MKILFNYRDQTQRCNSRLVLVESQLRASTSAGSDTYHFDNPQGELEHMLRFAQEAADQAASMAPHAA